LVKIEANRDIRFVLVGDGSLRGKLETIIESSGLRDYVTLLGNRDDVPRLLNGFDCFALPSLAEGFPVAILEAMACEIPIVATDVGGVAEALADGRCGVIIPPRDSEAIAEAIMRVRRNKHGAARMSAVALDRVRENYSLAVTADRYASLYQEILSKA
jgi:glycosyltransferase involved in cell wall biosynthesis